MDVNPTAVINTETVPKRALVQNRSMEISTIKRNRDTLRQPTSQLMADAKFSNVNELPPANGEEELLKLVQAGVKRFILDQTNIKEALRIYKDEAYSHPLTGPVFTGIVNDAMEKQSGSLRKTGKLGGCTSNLGSQSKTRTRSKAGKF